MSNDKASILTLVRSMLHIRRQHASLSQGEWRLLSREKDILAYERRNGETRIIVVLNFAANPRVWSITTSTKARVAISTEATKACSSNRYDNAFTCDEWRPHPR
jgi:glycosidase